MLDAVTAGVPHVQQLLAVLLAQAGARLIEHKADGCTTGPASAPDASRLSRRPGAVSSAQRVAAYQAQPVRSCHAQAEAPLMAVPACGSCGTTHARCAEVQTGPWPADFGLSVWCVGAPWKKLLLPEPLAPTAALGGKRCAHVHLGLQCARLTGCTEARACQAAGQLALHVADARTHDVDPAAEGLRDGLVLVALEAL